MPWYRLPGGGTVHLNMGRRRGPPHCLVPGVDGKPCGGMGTRQCDWKLGGGRTCDRFICTEHALQPAPDKDLCPEHQLAAMAWALL